MNQKEYADGAEPALRSVETAARELREAITARIEADQALLAMLDREPPPVDDDLDESEIPVVYNTPRGPQHPLKLSLIHI